MNSSFVAKTFKLQVFLLFASMQFHVAAHAVEAVTTADNRSDSGVQEKGPEDNQVASDPKNQQDLQNPRIVVQENLQEMQDVRTVSPEEGTDVGDRANEDPDNGTTSGTGKERKELKDELEIESPDQSRKLLGKTDKLMELSRKPLTYVQDHVPLLTKRNIIFFGRLELDGALYDGGVLEDEDGFDMRRLRLGLAGHIIKWPGWNYKLELDLTDGENSLSDFYLSRRFEKWGTVRIGNQKVAQTLSGQTSSLSIAFMERPLPVLAFTLRRRLGIGWDTHLKKLGANVTVFAGDPNESVGSEGWAARAYFNPTRDQFQVTHVGASIMQLSSENDSRIWARPESHVTNIRLVDTGVWPEVDVGSALGLELAGARGPLTFKSEFYSAEWSRKDARNPKFKGWYGEVSWFLSGESALYRDGKFIRPNISGNNGAWQVAVRFSTVNLNDEDVQGGTQKNLSFGVSWYSRTHWRFMANVIKVRADEGPYGEQDPWIVQVRGQYYF
jgi:phosphate-selective porin OprO/OprP